MANRAGKSRKIHVLDLFAGVAQAGAQDLDQLDRDLGLALHQRNEIATIDDQKLAIPAATASAVR